MKTTKRPSYVKRPRSKACKTLVSTRLHKFVSQLIKWANYSVEHQKETHAYGGSKAAHIVHTPKQKKVKAQKLAPTPENPVYNKPKPKVDHTKMVFIKSKNVWKDKDAVAKPASTHSLLYTQVINQMTKVPNELSPKEKRKAWRNSHIPRNWKGATAKRRRKAAKAA